jgi:thymidylate synthase
MNKLDQQYTALLQDILDNGVTKQDRTGTGTISVFGRQIRHDMKDGFPLLTTKKMPFKTIVTELLWFLRGDTNIKYLVDNNCHIWDGDAYKNFINHPDYKAECVADLMGSQAGQLVKCSTQEEFINKIKTDDKFAKKWGELGPIYGKQWRSWGSKTVKSVHDVTTFMRKNGEIIKEDSIMAVHNRKIDQIQNLINNLKTNPDSRRLMVNAWNVGELDSMVLPPCHYGFQVYTRELSLEERKDILKKNKQSALQLSIAEKLPFEMDGEEISKSEVIDMLFITHKIPTRAISLMWNQRSVDTFLGLPFNIASYGLLLEIIAKEVNMVPDQLIGNLGDVHLYSNHIEQAKEQIGRELTFDEFWDSLTPKQKGNMEKPYEGETYNGIDSRIELMNIISEIHNIPTRARQPFPLPTLKFNPCPITGISIEYQSIAQFEIENYQSHPAIKAPLSN